MAEDLIDRYVDRTGFEADTKFVLEQLNTSMELFKKLDGMKIRLDVDKSTKDLASSLSQIAQAQKELSTSTEKLQSIRKNDLAQTDAIGKAEQRLANTYTDEAKKLAELKVQQQQRNRELALEARATNQIASEYDRQVAKLSKLKKELKDLSVQGKENTDEFRNLKQEFDQIDTSVRKAEEGVKEFQRKVGSYAESLAGGFDQVANEIKRIKEENKGLESSFQNLSGGRVTVLGFGRGNRPADIDPKAAAQMEQYTVSINKNNQALAFLERTQQIGYKQNQTFKTTVKQLEQSYTDLATSGAISNEFLEEYKKFVAKAKDESQDLRDEIKALSSDTHKLDLATGAVKTLASGFETVYAAASLAGEGNEDAQRSIQKLLAVQSIANGIREVSTDLTRKETLAGKAYATVQGLIATATDKTAASSVRLKAALSIFGILLTVVGAVVVAYLALNKSQDDFTRRQQIMNDISKEAVQNYAAETSRLEILKKIILDTSLSTEKRKTAVREYNKAADEANKIDEKTLDNTRLIEAAINRQIELIKKRALAKAAENAVAAKAEDLIEAQLELEAKAPQFGSKAEDAIVTRINTIVEKRQKALGIAGNFDPKEIAALAGLDDETINAMSKNSDKFKIVLDKSSRSTLAYLYEQVSAIDKARSGENKFTGTMIASLQKRVDVARKAFDEITQLAFPLISDVGGQTSPDNSGSGKDNKAEQQLEREKKAALELFKFRKQLEIDAAKVVVSYSSGNEKVKARTQQNKLEEELIKGIANYELSQKDITATEVLLIEEKLSEDLQNLKSKRIIDIATFAQEERKQFEEQADETAKYLKDREEARIQGQIASQEKQLQKSIATIEKYKNEDIAKENEAYAKKLRAAGKNNSKREQAEKDHQKNLNRIQANAAKAALEVQIGVYETLSKNLDLPADKVEELKNKIAELKKSLSELNINGDGFDPSVLEDFKDKFEKVKDYFLQVSTLIGNAFDAAATKQKNLIQEQIDILDKQKEKDIEVANQTIINEEEKAAAIAVINARAQARKEEMERRQRQIDERTAKYKKAATIAQIILDTASAVMKTYATGGFFGGLAGAIAVGALGAAQLALAVATDIPKYFIETKNHPGGPAIVGEVPEVVTEPGKKPYLVSEPTLIPDLKKQATVFHASRFTNDLLNGKPQLNRVKSKDIILPDARKALAVSAKEAMQQTDRLMLNGSLVKISQPEVDFSTLEKQLKNQTRLLQKISEKRELHLDASEGGLTAMWKYGASRVTYINENTNW